MRVKEVDENLEMIKPGDGRLQLIKFMIVKY